MAAKATFTAIFCSIVCFATSPAFSLDVETLKKGVVRVTATIEDGKTKVGTGFIVRRQANAAYIVTASHVVESTRKVEVEFFTERNHHFLARVIGQEGGDPQGLAVLLVEKDVPPDTIVLQLNQGIQASAGNPVTMIGFPRIAGASWAVTKGEVVGRKAKSIVFSGAVDEGSSGGPLIKDNQVIGVVTEATEKFAYAVPTVIARYVLETWGVKFGMQLRSAPVTLEETDLSNMIAGAGDVQHEYEAQNLRSAQVVIDHATGLMWQRSGSLKPLKPEGAEDYIQGLNQEGHGGFTDWRFPTSEELVSVLERRGINNGLFIDPAFDSLQTVLWSADRIAARENYSLFAFLQIYDRKYVTTDARGVSGSRVWVRAVRSLYLEEGSKSVEDNTPQQRP